MIPPYENTNMKASCPRAGRATEQMNITKLQMCTCTPKVPPCPGNQCYCCDLATDLCFETPEQCRHGCAPGCRARTLTHP